MYESKIILVAIGAVLVVLGVLAVKFKLVTVTQIPYSLSLKISIFLCLLVSVLLLIPGLIRFLGRT